MMVDFTLTPTPFMWFTAQVKAGIRYALFFLIIAFAMGVLFGLFGGLLFQPGLFATSLVGIFCLMNFPFALLAALINLILAAFKRSLQPVYRYFGLSLGFAVVYLLYFYVLHLAHIEVF
ncbi:hypothetical protein GCM10028819_06080 [Spirosoma humi]